MRTFDIEEARDRLEALVDQAAAGGPFMIAVDDKPLVTVVALDAEEIARLVIEDDGSGDEA